MRKAPLIERRRGFITLLYSAYGQRVARKFAHDEHRDRKLRAALLQYTLDGLRAHQCPLQEPTLRGLLDMDMNLNTQGLGMWLDSNQLT